MQAIEHKSVFCMACGTMTDHELVRIEGMTITVCEKCGRKDFLA